MVTKTTFIFLAKELWARFEPRSKKRELGKKISKWCTPYKASTASTACPTEAASKVGHYASISVSYSIYMALYAYAVRDKAVFETFANGVISFKRKVMRKKVFVWAKSPVDTTRAVSFPVGAVYASRTWSRWPGGGRSHPTDGSKQMLHFDLYSEYTSYFKQSNTCFICTKRFTFNYFQMIDKAFTMETVDECHFVGTVLFMSGFYQLCVQQFTFKFHLRWNAFTPKSCK